MGTNKKIKYVVGIITDMEKVVLIKKNRPDWQKGVYNGVGGKVEQNEIAIEAMKREAEEECGLCLDKWFLYDIEEPNDHMLYMFYSVVSKEQILSAKTLTDEEIGIFDISNIPINTQNNIKIMIQDIQKSNILKNKRKNICHL